MGPADLAVLAVLLLGACRPSARCGPRRSACTRSVGPGEVDAVLDALAARTPRPFAARVAGAAGDREIRWVEVLTGPAAAPRRGPGRRRGPRRRFDRRRRADGQLAPTYAELVARVADLERRLAGAWSGRRPPGDWSRRHPPPPAPVEVGAPGRSGPAGGRATAPAAQAGGRRPRRPSPSWPTWPGRPPGRHRAPPGPHRGRAGALR